MAKPRAKTNDDFVEKFENVELADFADECIKIYGSEVIENRAFVDYHDGLKPVFRRILYAMYKLGLNPSAPHMKSARSVADTMGKYHPHGSCLNGDTKVALLDGSFDTLKNLKKVYSREDTKVDVLAFDETTQSFVPAKAHSFRIGTLTDEEYVLTLSDGSKIHATGNHPFMVDGEWVETSELDIGNALTSASLYCNSGYRGFRSQGSYTKAPLHRIIGYSMYGEYPQGNDIHHKNELKIDNRPSNLELLSGEEHAAEHAGSTGALVGLDKGRISMFSSNGSCRETTKQKNSILMKEINKNLPLLKALKLLRLLRDSGKKLTEKNYSIIRDSGRVYNSPRLETLYAAGHSFISLIEEMDLRHLDTKESIGLNIGSRKCDTKETRIRKGQDKFSSKHRLSSRASEVCTYCIDHKNLQSLTWNHYEKARKILASQGIGFGNIHKRNYPKHSTLIKYGVVSTEDSFQDFIRILSPEYMLIITNIVVNKVFNKKMYDFTVDKYENLCIATKKKEGIATLVVAHNSAIYSAMVGLANSPEPTVDGAGNWGKINAPAAADRYTNARLSNFAWLNFFNPRYVNVMEYVANYDGKDLEPVVLNGVLPNVFLNGGSGIGLAVTSNVPPLKLEGLYHLVREALQNEGEVQRKSLLKHVELNPPYGGTVHKDTDEAVAQFKNFLIKNESQLEFECDYTFDQAKKELIITGVPPGVNPDTACIWCEERIKVVDFARDAVDKHTPEGEMCFMIVFRRNASEHDMMDAVQKIVGRFSSRESYKINVTNRTLVTSEASGLSYDTVGVRFHRATIPSILKQWTKHRIDLESRALVYEEQILNGQIKRLELLIFAVLNRKVILESLSSPDPDAYLVKALKISTEDAKSILDLKIRQLSKMDGDKLEEELAERKKELAENKKWQKDPAGRALIECDSTVEKLRAINAKLQKEKEARDSRNTSKQGRATKKTKVEETEDDTDYSDED